MRIKKEDLYLLISESVRNGIYSVLYEGWGKEDIANSDVIRMKKDAIMGHIRNRIDGDIPTNNDDSYIDDITTIGINPNFNSEDRKRVKSSYFNKGKYKGFDVVLRNRLVSAASVLHRYSNKSSQTFNFNKMRSDCNNSSDGRIDGFSYSDLVKHKEFFDTKGVEYLYLSDNDNVRSRFKLNNKTIGKLDDYRYNNDKSDIFSDEYAIAKMRESLLSNYMAKVYGLNVNLPGEVFSKGNAKLPNDMLIINFTSAMQCPAWNECLIKSACYARANEKMYSNTRNANVYRNLMWRSSYNDDKLTSMIYDLIKLYSIDYGKVLFELGMDVNNDEIEKLSSKNFSDMDEETLGIIKKHRIVTTIRLNENGDFIGDWLVEKIDVMAGDLSLVDISCSAYTCRHLKSIENVSNIIINSSNLSLNGDSINRYFIALPSELFDCFENTYLNFDGRKRIKKDYEIEASPRPLYSYKSNQLNGNYFYKCPCDLRDGVNCYNCKMCYTADNKLPLDSSSSDSILYVFVKAHGGSASRLNNSWILKHIGSTPTFIKNYNENKKIKNSGRLKIDKNLNESIIREEIASGVNGGVYNVANNCINSIKTHLNEKSFE